MAPDKRVFGQGPQTPALASPAATTPSGSKRPRPEDNGYFPHNMHGGRNMPIMEGSSGMQMDGPIKMQARDTSRSPEVHLPLGSRPSRNSHPGPGEISKEGRSRTPTVEESDSKNEPSRYSQPIKEETKGPSDKKPKDGVDWTMSKNTGAVNGNVAVDLAYSLGHTSVVCCVKFSRDGRYLATGCNKSAQIYDVETGEKSCIFSDELLEVEGTRKEGDLYIRSVCFSPDGKYLAAGAEDRTVKVWDIHRRLTKQVFSGHELDIYSLDFSPDGKIIVSGSGDRKTKVWNLDKGELLYTLHTDEVGPRDGVTSVAISPDGRLVACGSLDKVVRIWDLQTGQFKERFEGHEDSVYSVAFSPDGTRLASGSLDTTVKIWDVAGSRSQRNRPPITLGASSSSSQNRPSNGHKDFVLSVAFSPDGNWLVSGSKDRTVRFWDLKTSNWNVQLQGHKNSVISVAVNPERGLFATGSGDHRARLWKYSIN
eukprot:TRINITY_DN20024_c0_g1_i1.p1 TRINITY_DN20024_c0_g1~~TRINITY_DN20024_c0_g1_i1.p1  ORF type:complete len:481 (+),score=78.01 TRINITY_DN20024_c0_g1_i1:144-1586(+)